MREITTKVFKFQELSDDAKEKARVWYRGGEDYSDVVEEVADSLKALLKAAGIRLIDWSIGDDQRRSFVRFDMGDAGELSGKRAIAWLENNLLAGLRFKRPVTVEEKKRYKTYGYKVGEVETCPFTGVCYDDDLLDALRKKVKGGMTLKDAFYCLADEASRIISDEIESRQEDDYVDEMITANDYEFTEDGKVIR